MQMKIKLEFNWRWKSGSSQFSTPYWFLTSYKLQQCKTERLRAQLHSKFTNWDTEKLTKNYNKNSMSVIGYLCARVWYEDLPLTADNCFRLVRASWACLFVLALPCLKASTNAQTRGWFRECLWLSTLNILSMIQVVLSWSSPGRTSMKREITALITPNCSSSFTALLKLLEVSITRVDSASTVAIWTLVLLSVSRSTRGLMELLFSKHSWLSSSHGALCIEHVEGSSEERLHLKTR